MIGAVWGAPVAAILISAASVTVAWAGYVAPDYDLPADWPVVSHAPTIYGERRGIRCVEVLGDDLEGGKAGPLPWCIDTPVAIRPSRPLDRLFAAPLQAPHDYVSAWAGASSFSGGRNGANGTVSRPSRAGGSGIGGGGGGSGGGQSGAVVYVTETTTLIERLCCLFCGPEAPGFETPTAPTPVPAPATLPLIAAAFALLVVARRLRR